MLIYIPPNTLLRADLILPSHAKMGGFVASTLPLRGRCILYYKLLLYSTIRGYCEANNKEKNVPVPQL